MLVKEEYKSVNSGGVYRSVNLNMDLLDEDEKRQLPWYMLREAYKYQLKHNPSEELMQAYMVDKIMSTFKWNPKPKPFSTRLKILLKCYWNNHKRKGKKKKKCRWIRKMKGDVSIVARI